MDSNSEGAMKRIYHIVVISVLALSLQACEGNVPVAEILGQSCSAVNEVLWDTSFVLSNGVLYSELTLKTSGDAMQQIHLLKVESRKGNMLKMVLPENSTDITGGWRKQTLTEMSDVLAGDGYEVIAMTNADFWNTAEPINPRGPVHCGGYTVSPSWDYSDRVPQQALSFVGICKDGTPIIEEKAGYDSVASELEECCGSGVIMLADGEVTEDKYNLRDPRTAIGYGLDGTFWLLVADGRGFSGAAGLTYREMGEIFKALGCEAAVNLDGGGSAQMLIRDRATGKHYIANSPCDGKERPVISGWAIIKK